MTDSDWQVLEDLEKILDVRIQHPPFIIFNFNSVRY